MRYVASRLRAHAPAGYTPRYLVRRTDDKNVAVPPLVTCAVAAYATETAVFCKPISRGLCSNDPSTRRNTRGIESRKGPEIKLATKRWSRRIYRSRATAREMSFYANGCHR